MGWLSTKGVKKKPLSTSKFNSKLAKSGPTAGNVQSWIKKWLSLQVYTMISFATSEPNDSQLPKVLSEVTKHYFSKVPSAARTCTFHFSALKCFQLKCVVTREQQQQEQLLLHQWFLTQEGLQNTTSREMLSYPRGWNVINHQITQLTICRPTEQSTEIKVDINNENSSLIISV